MNNKHIMLKLICVFFLTYSLAITNGDNNGSSKKDSTSTDLLLEGEQ
jgi:hypothetical protein